MKSSKDVEPFITSYVHENPNLPDWGLGRLNTSLEMYSLSANLSLCLYILD